MKEKDVKGEKEGKKVDTFQVSTLHLPTFHLREAKAPTLHLPEAEAEGEDVLEEGEEEKIRIRITSALCRKVKAHSSTPLPRYSYRVQGDLRRRF